jgi:hypothetical protein
MFIERKSTKKIVMCKIILHLIVFHIDEVPISFLCFRFFKVTVDPDCAVAHWHYFDVFSSGPLSKTLCRNSWGKTFTVLNICAFTSCVLWDIFWWLFLIFFDVWLVRFFRIKSLVVVVRMQNCSAEVQGPSVYRQLKKI